MSADNARFHCIYLSPDSWAVHAEMDPVFCNALVDFNVPGKPNPPSISVVATVWTLTHFLLIGTEEKYALEFTDPNSQSPGVPLNTWVQVENVATKPHLVYPVSAPKECLTPG